MEEKETYSLDILFEDLPISILELSRQSKLSEVTIARIRDGKPARRATANKLLQALSRIYEKPFNLRNVTGVNVQVNQRQAERDAKREAKVGKKKNAA